MVKHCYRKMRQCFFIPPEDMMKHVLILFLFFPISLFSQSIDGFSGFKFGTPQHKVMEIPWVRDSIVQQKGDEKDMHVFVKNVTFNGQTYDMCLYMFYKKKLYGGIMSKSFPSEESLLKALYQFRDSIQIEAKILENTYFPAEILARYIYDDANENQLVVEAAKQKGYYILRFSYASLHLAMKKKKEEDKKLKRRNSDSKEPQVQSID